MGKSVRIVFALLLVAVFLPQCIHAQINAERVLLMGRNALYYEDYVLAIQRFNMVINAKPWLGKPYFYRGLAKFYLEDFQGSEIDCGEAIERNPYAINHYVLRALTRINQERYSLAEEDYVKALDINPLEKNCWHNIVLCQLELKEYERADSSLDVMIRHWPNEAENYTLKAQVALAVGDSVRAESWIDQALEVNAYEGRAWSMKSVFQAARGEYAGTEESLDKAILQMPRTAGLYINRALARYNQDNLRGAMSDYDTALDLEPANWLAHYNRALLRANVGDDNLAIEDFDYVLSVEPDNTIALYNRALLLDNVGDYNGAIRDISAVIKDYPDFWDGYRKRASILRKIGDVYGAERDEFRVMKAQLAVATGTYKSSGKTRRKSDRNIEDYGKLVEEDSVGTDNEYASDYRGRVQNRSTELRVEQLYVLTYYSQPSEVKQYVPFCPALETLNERHVLPLQLYIADAESSMTEDQTERHLSSISRLSDSIQGNVADHYLLMARALDYYHVRDFENSIVDMNSYLQDTPDDVLALMLRAQVRYAQMKVQGASLSASDVRLGFLMVMQDYVRAAEIQPELAFLHYNIGCIRMELSDNNGAVDAFSRAITIDPHFPDAYFGRGVAYLIDGKSQEGLSDLSKAGEYGLYHAYNLIKKYSSQKK